MNVFRVRLTSVFVSCMIFCLGNISAADPKNNNAPKPKLSVRTPKSFGIMRNSGDNALLKLTKYVLNISAPGIVKVKGL